MALTPMMQQYFDIKEQYKDCILFFRLGDFYEMFFDDAITASKELEITLTARDCGQEERAPMCGVPHHAAENYITRLISKGFKVAICEQIEDVALAKGIVKRDVTRVVTPGTLVESSMLDAKKNNYLMSIYKDKHVGLAVVDVSTGELFVSNIVFGNVVSKLYDEIVRFAPSEILANSTLFEDASFVEMVSGRLNIYITKLESENFEFASALEKINNQFENVSHISDDNISDKSANNISDKSTNDISDLSANNISNSTTNAISDLTSGNVWINALGALLTYLKRTSKVNLLHIKEMKKYSVEGYMNIDISTRRNLEICETMREKSKKGSILWVLDKTQTSMGGRMLRRWIEQPLINVSDINDRLNAVDEYKNKFMVRTEIRDYLKRVYDIERLIGRVVLGNANGRDLIALKNSVAQIPQIKELLKNCNSLLSNRIFEQMDTLDDIFTLIEAAIEDEPPVAIKEGGIIKSAYDDEVDLLRKASLEGKNWIIEIENKEKEKTGIKNLKVGFNKVFGYYLEVTKSYFNLVPDYFVRKQTLANCERYITSDLKEIEDTVLGAEEKLIALEYEVFLNVRQKLMDESERIKKTALALALLDVISSLAETADNFNYCRPTVDNGNNINVIDGRHPVVEKMLPDEKFIPNDTILDLEENRISIITGPNMAGKSTYMRQVAIIVLLAQIGSFVPAKEAVIGVVDRIFTRVGASDDLASGQSTFMVEMSEVANIVANATSRSLIILDEIGRGTSTYDGLSIAWSVIEYISQKDKIGARTLFATHYHELTELEEKMNGIKNYCIAVKEKGDDIIFLRKIIRGGADGSYGIQVAKLAGLPNAVISRAKELLKELENADIAKAHFKNRKNKKPIEGQIDIFSLNKPTSSENQILSDLNEVNLGAITPIDALNMLYDFQQRLKRG